MHRVAVCLGERPPAPEYPVADGEGFSAADADDGDSPSGGGCRGDDGIVIGDTAYYVMTQDGIEQERFLGEMTAKRSWLGTWKFYSMGSGNSGINYDVIGCGGHNFLLLSGKDPEQQVAKVTLNWYGQTYEMTNESAKPYFLLCTELTGYMPDELLPSEDMFRFYDKNGKEIPRWYDSYSGTMNGSSIAVAQGSIYKAE